MAQEPTVTPESIDKTSFIHIQFEELGDGNPQIFFHNVNAFQLMGSAAALEVYGKNMFVRELNEKEEARQRSQLAVPKPEILVGR